MTVATATPAPPVVRRRSAYADRLLAFSDFAFSDDAPSAHRGAWRACFATRIGERFDGRVVFEVGCNDASLLTRVAARHPATAFIGIDWKCRALHAAAERIVVGGLRNVALLHGRAQDITRFFAEEELDEIWLFHPDPCDKPRELPNRLFAEPFLRDAHRALRAGAPLVLKTDHPGYYRWALDVSGGAMIDRLAMTVNSGDFWNDAAARTAVAGRCFADETTFFEARYQKRRRPIHFLELRKR